jgi:YVTN family beta-propeller protein
MLAGPELRLRDGVADTPTSPPGVRGDPGDALLAPGRVFAGHEILREAGRGGMGIVYAARHVRLQVVRALKVLTERTADDGVFRARFERECQLAASLEHPNVVQVYEAGESDGALYLSMRYVDGPNLGQVLATEGPLAPDRVVELVSQVAAGLDAAHDAGLVHRDVKPANILLEDRAGGTRAFLGDFGISRMLAPSGRLTETGEMLGTVDYVAPEQIAGTSVDARSDVYSLACVAFEALTGRPPFKRESRLATMFAHANAPRPHATERNPDLPRAVDSVFARALAIDPNRRYPRASEFAQDLDAALAGRRIAAASLRSRTGWLAIAAAIVAVLGITAAVLAFTGTFGGGSGGSGSEKGRPLAAPPAKVVGTVKIADPPTSLAIGEFNLWTASQRAGTISAVVPVTSDRARPPISVPGKPASLIPGFGSIWVVDQTRDALVRVDPKRAAGTRIPVGRGPSDVAVSASHLWVANRGDDTVSRIDPLTNRVDETRPVGNSPASVAVGEGGVWVADSGDGTVTELDPVSGKPRGRPVHVGGSPTAIAAGEAGVWVVDSANGRLVRISPGPRDVTPVTTGAAQATAVATGFGYAWITSADGTVERIDPALLRPAGEPIDVGGRPTAIAAGDGFVWAGGTRTPELTRIDPRATRG